MARILLLIQYNFQIGAEASIENIQNLNKVDNTILNQGSKVGIELNSFRRLEEALPINNIRGGRIRGGIIEGSIPRGLTLLELSSSSSTAGLTGLGVLFNLVLIVREL